MFMLTHIRGFVYSFEYAGERCDVFKNAAVESNKNCKYRVFYW